MFVILVPLVPFAIIFSEPRMPEILISRVSVGNYARSSYLLCEPRVFQAFLPSWHRVLNSNDNTNHCFSFLLSTVDKKGTALRRIIAALLASSIYIRFL